jgi:hypothetical protein
LRIESSGNDFISYNSIVLDTDNKWGIINNLAVVTAKKSRILKLKKEKPVAINVKNNRANISKSNRFGLI